MSRHPDMSLDDIVRTRARYEGHYGAPGGGGWSHGPGPDRRAPFRDLIRANPYPVPPIFDGMQQELRPSGIPDTEGAKLYISNLDYDVTNTDIQLLFSEVGDLKSYSIHYDRSGRSKGTAEVVFYHQTDALAAIKRYNNVRLDGKPLKIELVGVNLVTPAPVLVNSGRSASLPVNFSRPRPLLVNMGRPAPIDSSENIIPRRRAINVASGSIQEKVGARESLHGGGGHGFAGNREQGSCADQLTFADLDADLDKYRLEALKKK